MKQYHLAIIFAVLSFIIVLMNSWPNVQQHQLWFLTIIFIGFFAFFATLYMIPRLMTFMLRGDIWGYDLNKKGSKLGEIKIPQSIGFASATAFVLSSFVFCLAIGKIVPQRFLVTHLACSLTILGTILLGFADDMIDLPWRYKLFLPFFIVLPVVTSYTTSTIIHLPYPFCQMLGNSINIGFVYYIYLTLLGIYCTNAINIYAGINGLQVGQSIIVAGTQLILIAIRVSKSKNFQMYSYSIFLLTVFLGSALALMKYNAYPSRVFVGDTFCYYSGIVIAISAMVSQTGIIVQFLLIPQLINFLYSIPQLFGFFVCPRHRLPQHNEHQDTLKGVKTNMNLLNLSLLILGPTNQEKLCKKLLWFQLLCAIPILVLSILYEFA